MNNLAQGKRVCVASTAYGAHAENEARLTDGILGELSGLGTWIRFDGGISVELVLDLGSVCAVDRFDIGFLQDKKSNIYCPEKVELFVSSDSKEFHLAETVFAPYPASFDLKTRATYRADLKNSVAARFVKLKFGVEGIAACDEWRVYGGEAIGTETEISSLPLESADKNRFASRDSLGGCTDLATLTFADLSEQGTVSRLAYADFIPCLAYLDENGSATDVMFDSIALCQSKFGNCPSGGCLTSRRAEASSLSDWEWLIDELFAKDSNLMALDTAAFDVKSMLGLPRDYKFKVFITSPIPKTGFDEFGDMNGDGIGEKLLTSEDCISAFSWYVDAVARRFEAECLQNIAIKGFVWADDFINRIQHEDVQAFASGCVSELKKRGYKSIFAPSYMADGCERAESIGFDCTAMQYNGENERFLSACKKYGFGVCFGANERNRSNTVAFAQQLDSLAQSGVMSETVHMFDRAEKLCGCAFSQDNKLRGIYDGLYRFIKGIFGQTPDAETEEKEIAIPELADPWPEIAETVSVNEPAPEISEAQTSPQECEAIGSAQDDCGPEAEIPESEIKIRIEIEPEKTRFEPIPDDRPPHRMPPPPPPPEPCCARNGCVKRKKYKKIASLGIGLAAAVGAVYIISKITKGNKNG